MKSFGGLAALLFFAGVAGAQELEPRAYAPSPVGTTFVIVSATRSAGGVFTDPSVPIRNVDATAGLLGLTLGRTFDLLGRQALVLGLVPITWGKVSGEVFEDARTVTRRGLADPRVRLSVVLWGARSMTPAEFVKTLRRTTVGASVTIVPPVGQYEPAKLVNLGSNRWAIKPEVGLSRPAGRWTLEAYTGVWFFTANDSYFPGTSTREQDPILAIQGHVSYALTRRAWAGLNATWYTGGRSRIDGASNADLQRNTRLGATVSFPLGARQSLKFAYSAGAATRIGADFRTITAAWQIVVF
jgi:hypothetical protein